jgi:ADP-ribosylglycohydrolase
MVSDDTEHTCIVAQSLIAAGDDVDAFARQLAWRLRWWLLGIPAGIGLATLRAILKLWVGFPPSRSGMFSAGNGPAMRAAIFGAAIDEIETIERFVRVSSRITHTDPKAEYAALAVALAARAARLRHTPEKFIDDLARQLPPDGQELLDLVRRAATSAASGEATAAFAESLGLAKGVSGYSYHTVPAAIQAWLAHRNDLAAALQAIIVCGGDTDSIAAIVGGIVGSSLTADELPPQLLAGLGEWPRTVGWMQRLAAQLADVRTTQRGLRPLRLPLLAVAARNAWFLAVVLVHGFRRLLPPY